MEQELAISLSNVSKCFKRYDRPMDRLKEILKPNKKYADDFWALKDINLEIPKGQTVGIVGRNGSGKSTLLQIIAGTLTPTTGEVNVKGRISALLELGCGFNPEFTGRQNVFFNGRLLGLNQKEIEDKFDEIAGFADIGDFIDRSVKTYSSGMFVRLAFAVAVNVNPEILIVDEALAVGDFVFQHRCMRRMRDLMDSGVTTLFVSHDPNTIKTLCDWSILVQKGQIIDSGLPNIIIQKYAKLATELELDLLSLAHKPPTLVELGNPKLDNSSHLLSNENSINSGYIEQTFRRGSGKARIQVIKILDSNHQDITNTLIVDFNQEIVLSIELKINEYLENCIVGFFVCDRNGIEIIGSNTHEENIKITNLQPNEELATQFKFRLPLRPNSYSITVAVAESYEDLTLDWIDNAIVIKILPPITNKRIAALVDVNIETEVFKLSSIN